MTRPVLVVLTSLLVIAALVSCSWTENEPPGPSESESGPTESSGPASSSMRPMRPLDSGPDASPSERVSSATEHSGDFDGDGRTETLLPPEADGRTPVLLGRHEGKVTKRSFDDALAESYEMRNLSDNQAIGDFDGDGYDDLVLCDEGPGPDDSEGSVTLVVLFGAENDRADVVEIRSPIRKACPRLAAGDGDGDGRDDLFVSGGFELGFARPGKDARSAEAWEFELIERARSRTAVRIFDHIAVGDVDGDGRADLISERSHELEEADTWMFEVRTAADNYQTGKQQRRECSLPCQISVGDLRGDDKDDLVLFGRGEAMIWTGSADGIDVRDEPTYVRAETLELFNAPGFETSRLSKGGLADVDGDDADDLVFALPDVEGEPDLARALVVPGGKGGPRAEETYQLRSDRPVREYESGPPEEYYLDYELDYPMVQRTELDDDAGDGVVFTVPRGDEPEAPTSYLFDAGDRRPIDRRQREHRPVPDDQRAKAWDIDGDGTRDLPLVARGPDSDDIDGPISVLLGDPDGFAEGTLAVPPGEADSGTSLDLESTTSGDFDADGYADLAICVDDAPAVLFGSADGLRDDVRLDSVECDEPKAVDLDRDGYSDLVVVALDRPGATVFHGGPEVRRPGGWTAGRIHEREVDRVTVGDLNGDGRHDLVFTDEFERIHSYLGTEDGFDLDAVSGRGTGTGQGPNLDVGDLDGDGFDDVAQGNDHKREVRLWFGSEKGVDFDRKPRVVSARDLGLTGHNGFGDAIALGDADGDGYLELAVGASTASVDGNENAGRVVVLPGGPEGPDASRARVLDQSDVGSSPEKYDQFGGEVTYRDVTPEAGEELVVVSGGEDDRAGRVHVIGGDRTVRITPEDAGFPSKRELDIGL